MRNTETRIFGLGEDGEGGIVYLYVETSRKCFHPIDIGFLGPVVRLSKIVNIPGMRRNLLLWCTVTESTQYLQDSLDNRSL